MIETLWKRHYRAGITGSYHGDMARAFAAILRDKECDNATRRKIQHAIQVHQGIERHNREVSAPFSERFDMDGRPICRICRDALRQDDNFEVCRFCNEYVPGPIGDIAEANSSDPVLSNLAHAFRGGIIEAKRSCESDK